MEKTRIMDAEQIQRAITRMAHEVMERNKDVRDVALVGVYTMGVHLAARLAAEIKKIENADVPVGTLDISFYRDDASKVIKADVKATHIPFDVNGKVVLVVDDVLYTGRSTRAAMDALIDLGRPKAIRLAVLVDRGHRELPIRADYVGKNLPTSPGEKVDVVMREGGGDEEGVYLIKP